MGTVLEVNLSEGRLFFRKDDSFEHFGGRGYGSSLLFERLSKTAEALSDENIMIFSAGCMTGTSFPGTSRSALVTKNLQSGGISTSSGGASWGPVMRRAGVDAIVITGCASSPVWLAIDNGHAELRGASQLWGKSVWQTVDIIQNEISGAEVASIGPAGENLSYVACVMFDKAHALAWGGSGAVMGFKKLKAISVRGTNSIQIANTETFAQESKRYSWLLRASPATGALNEGGTHGMAGVGGWSGKVPTSVRNLQEEFWSPEKSARVNEAAYKKFEKKRTSCWNCPIHCLHKYEMEYNGEMMSVEGMHANSVRGLGSNLDLDDPFHLMKAHALCNELGMDVDGVSAAAAWAIECFERGIIDENDTGGLALRWGNGEAIVSLIRKIAIRDGFGSVLSDGVAKACRSVGCGSERFAMQVKGVGLNEQGVRSHKAWGFSMAVSARGGGHLSGAPQTENRGLPSSAGRWLFGAEKAGVPGEYAGKAKLVAWYEIYKAIIDSFGFCYFAAGWYDTSLADLNILAAAWNAMYVKPAYNKEISADDLKSYGRAIVETEKAFNTIHAGFERKDDILPDRVMDSPLSSGPYKGEHMDRGKFGAMLDEYYEYWGWDSKGLQRPEKLDELGLGNLACALRDRNNL